MEAAAFQLTMVLNVFADKDTKEKLVKWLNFAKLSHVLMVELAKKHF